MEARKEFLDLAEACGARITGKPDGSEPIEVIFAIDAWRAFDAALTPLPALAGEREAEVIAKAFHAELTLLPATMRRTIIDSLERDESNSWKFFRSGWHAALASRPTTPDRTPEQRERDEEYKRLAAECNCGIGGVGQCPFHGIRPTAQAPAEPHPCEEAARADLLDELEDARLEMQEHHGTWSSAVGKAINWIQGEEASPFTSLMPANLLREWQEATDEHTSSPVSTPAVLVEPAGWQPIDTAPKDGSAVLLFIVDAEHPFEDEPNSVSIGSYGVEGGPVDDPTWSFAGWSWHQDCYCKGNGTPTHWMPLSAAPSGVTKQPAPGPYLKRSGE